LLVPCSAIIIVGVTLHQMIFAIEPRWDRVITYMIAGYPPRYGVLVAVNDRIIVAGVLEHLGKTY